MAGCTQGEGLGERRRCFKVVVVVWQSQAKPQFFRFAMSWSISRTWLWGTRLRWYLFQMISRSDSRSSKGIGLNCVHSISDFRRDCSFHLPACLVAVTRRTSPSSVFSRHSCFFMSLWPGGARGVVGMGEAVGNRVRVTFDNVSDATLTRGVLFTLVIARGAGLLF